MPAHPIRTLSARRLTALASTMLMLTACGGGGGSNGASGLNGLAAVGAPIVGATVTAACADGNAYPVAPATATSDANGAWSLRGVPDSALPCAIKASGGTIGGSTTNTAPELYSYATALGRVNITPLTNLIVAYAAAMDPASWYNGFGRDDNLSTSPALTALESKGYIENPLTVAFNADGTGHDALLDQLGAALDAEAYAALIAAATTQNLDNLPAAQNGGNPPVEPEIPANIAVLTAYAGTYNVSGTSTVAQRDGTANREHQRKSVLIGEDGSVDFDTGISFTATQINAIYDRTNLQQPIRRVHVNYDADDSGRKLQLWLDADNQVTEISYSNGAGQLTRAAIGTAPEEPGTEEPGESPLGSSNGVTGLFNGERRTDLRVISYDAPPLKVGQGYARIGDNMTTGEGAFQVYLSGFFTASGQVGATQACKDNGAPGLQATIGGVTYYSMSTVGGSCQIKVLQVNGDSIHVGFSGTLGTFGSEDVLTISDGEFQYIADNFPADTRVTASFEGLVAGHINGKGNGTGDSGWAGFWSGFLSLVDTSAKPLSFTPAGGSALSGGNTALQIQDAGGISMDGRLLEKTFNSDVYVSTLIRIDGTDAILSNSSLVLPWGTLGINTNGEETDQFHFNNQRFGGKVASNTTYLLVARLSKTGDSPTYNKADVWVNPGTSDSAAPQSSISVTGSPTGSAYRFYKLGFQSSQQLRPLLIDRIRISDTWEGLFAQ